MPRQMQNMTASLVFSALVAGGSSLPALAGVVAPPVDPENGGQLAVKLCATCHVVSNEDAASKAAGIPSFAAIANAEGQTAELVAGSIIVPHPEMPTVPLTLPEIRDIVGYIMTLKTEDGSKP